MIFHLSYSSTSFSVILESVDYVIASSFNEMGSCYFQMHSCAECLERNKDKWCRGGVTDSYRN